MFHRTVRRSWTLPAACFLVACVAAGAAAQGILAAGTGFDPMVAPQMRSDACLHDVSFVSPTTGWAVGQRGTIWHTHDAGRTWQLQSSGVGCPLYSVWFLDERVGWAAGGTIHPYRHDSNGVLLRTVDGGKKWTLTSKLLVPAIHKIRFFDRTAGFALGDASAMFPSGALVTQSGGHDWRPIHGEQPFGFAGGDLIDLNTGALAGRRGTVAAVRRSTLETGRSPRFGLRGLRDLRLVQPTWGWLVGDGALVMLTGDLGLTWQSTPGELPDGVFRNFDFRALAVRGPKCWVAGSPGTLVLRTDDAGKTWTASPTGQNAPIHALAMADDQHGWAVGSLGTILATDDGGQTWRRQRAGGSRAALFGIFSQGTDVPLELFAQMSGNDGYLGVVEVVNREDPAASPRGGAALEDRLREAAARLGASDAAVSWRFPSHSDAWEQSGRATMEDWDRANDGRGLAALEAHLVREIRLWRPEVVVTHAADSTGSDPRRHLIHQAVLAAVERAADPTSYVDQITGAGLEPWQVKKVHGCEGTASDAPTSVSEAHIAERLGRSLGEVAADARGLVEDRFTPGPKALGFRLLLDRTGSVSDQKDIFSRISLAPGGDARRNLVDPPAGDLASLSRLARQRRNVQAVLRQSEKAPRAGSQLLAHADELTEGMDASSAARLLYHLGSQYQRRGQWPLAAETFAALADRYPDHPLAGEALVWLVQYYSSLEAAWRIQGAQRKTIQADGRPATSKLAIDQSIQENRPAMAAELAKRIARTRPELFAEPEVRFPLAVADRMRGLPGEAERYLMGQRRRVEHDAWWSCAAGEDWLVKPAGHAPKPIVRCVAAAEKPKLDGRLDEPCWERAAGAVMGPVEAGRPPRPATVKFAYDDQFLYVAWQCPREPGVDYDAAPGPRPRDADLSGRDRVELLLDIDRDYVSYYRLAVDHRGWTRDECWGDSSWDPTWFVAAAADDGGWTIEAAIALDGLTGRYPRAGDVWAMGVQRLVPGVGFASWNAPASPEIVPEGFGYLVFE